MRNRIYQNNAFAIEQDIPYASHMQETIRLAQDRFQNRRPTLSFGRLIMKQLKFLAWKIWMVQGMTLAVLCCLFIHTFEVRYWSGTALSKFLCCCSGIIVFCAVPVSKRAKRYHMAELEQSTLYSVKGCLLSQLLFIGIGDLGMLSILAVTARSYDLTHKVIFLSLVIPFLTSASACLMLWIRSTPQFFERAVILFCILPPLLTILVIEKYETAFFDIESIYQYLYAALCVGILFYGCRNLYTRNNTENMLP